MKSTMHPPTPGCHIHGISISALVVILGWCALNGRADIVNDGCYHGAGKYQVQWYSIGQSFVAADDSLHAISVRVSDFNGWLFPYDHDLTIELYEGEGFDGALIDSATVNDIPDLYDGNLWFLFPDGIKLRVGTPYTLLIVDDTARWGMDITLDDYDDGTAWFFGEPEPRRDIRFRVLADALSPELPCTVTFDDLERLISCMGGPNVWRGIGLCLWGRLDDDSDIDLADFARLQTEFTGEIR